MMRNHTKTIMIIVILLFVASCFAGYGLYSGGGEEGTRDYPVAEVDGRQIMRSELERGAARLSEQYGSQIVSDDVPQIRKAVLEGMVIQAELEKEIASRKIDVSNDEINAAYTNIMDSYPTREEFLSSIERSGVTEKQIKDDIRRQIQMQKMMETLAQGVSVDSKEVSAFYDAARELLYKQPAGVMVNIATFKNRESAEAAQKAIAAGAKWDAEMEKYKADIEMATSYDTPMLFTEQMMQGELETLKDYPMNKITPVEKAGEQFSYIAIKRRNEAERVLSFNEVSGDVSSRIRNQKMQEEQQKFYGELLARAEVKILDTSIFPAEGTAGAAASADTAAAVSGDVASADAKN
ncbi:MAG: SurA N-terminal domain-containing protein [Synergistaceae bacterium]|nr:SurA N-terminal domain-containing protein [Synergistaceae bacterium]